MNICRVSSAFPPIIDGRAHHVWGLSVAQAQLGHRVWILQPHSPSAPEEVTNVVVRRVSIPGRSTAVFKSKIAKLYFAVKAGLEVLRLHSEIKFDIIHAHGDIFECLGLYLPSKLLHVPLILTVHGGLNERLVYRRVASLVLSFPNAIIVTSQFIADQAARLGVSQQNVFVISSGVSSMFFVTYREPRVKWSASPLRVVFVGRLHPVKGLSYLLSAVKSLEGQLPIELTLVGDGPERARLEAEARSLPNVHFLGEKQPVEVASLLAQADLFVMPSVDLEKQAEGTPTAVIEAMAAGLPIVCTDAGGLPRLVQHNVNGLVVPQRDPVALARAIWHLATEPELRQAMGKHNCQIARSRDWSVIVEQVEYVYRRAMKPWLSCQSSL